MDADTSTEPKSQPSRGARAADEFIEIVKTIVYALGIALVLRVLLFQPFTIPSGSMIPNLMIGDYIIVTKYSYGYSKHSVPFSPPIFEGRILAQNPRRGDIIVFKDTKDNRTDYIKRLMGLPGDRIQMVEGVPHINGVALRHEVIEPKQADDYSSVTEIRETNPEGRSYVVQDSFYNRDVDDTGVFIVPEGYYFFMGDNRDNSADSRVAQANGGVGFVPSENLVGRAQIILFSWDGAKLAQPWTWFSKARGDRFFHALK